jgi:hypothetical protein
MPYQDKKLLTINSNFPNKHHFLMQSIEVKRKHIEHAKNYVTNQDVSWWDIFFLDQQKINDYCLHGSWPISMPFTTRESVVCHDNLPRVCRDN